MRMALTRANGGRPQLDVWHGDTSLPDGVDLIVLPGGFSYGDYLRCGAMAAHSPIMQDVRQRAAAGVRVLAVCNGRSEEHTSELQSLMRISYAVFCLKKKRKAEQTAALQSRMPL